MKKSIVNASMNKFGAVILCAILMFTLGATFVTAADGSVSPEELRIMWEAHDTKYTDCVV